MESENLLILLLFYQLYPVIPYSLITPLSSEFSYMPIMKSIVHNLFFREIQFDINNTFTKKLMNSKYFLIIISYRINRIVKQNQ